MFRLDVHGDVNANSKTAFNLFDLILCDVKKPAGILLCRLTVKKVFTLSEKFSKC